MTDGETPDTKGRIYELAAEVARLVCVSDAPYVDDPPARRRLDLACNELGHLLGLPEPEFADIWPYDDETRAEELARRFHDEYERLAPEFGYETRPESAVPWDQVPENNRALMVAVCETILTEEAISPTDVMRLEDRTDK